MSWTLFLVALLQAGSGDDDLPGGPAMTAYYYCVAGTADSLALAPRGPERRAAEDIADESIRSCSHLREAAYEAVLPVVMKEPGVEEYLRSRNLSPEEGRRLAAAELEGALRRRLVRNVAELRGEARQESPDAED